MNRIIRFGFATYESLIQKLGSADSHTAVFQLFQQHKDLFKLEHVVLSLRMLGRYSRQVNQEDNLNELTGKLNEIVGQLSEYDVVDVIFWLRKFRTSKLATNVTQETQILLFQKIQQMAENHMFTFRNMTNIYYDLALLNQNNDFLAKIIQDQILTSKQISPFIVIQLLSAQVAKINNCNISKFDLNILQNCMKVLDNILDDFDVEQKSLLFKNLSDVQFQNISPRFSLPQQVKRIKDQLMEKVELLQEESVLNIFKAYQSLPKYFENDLLRELKDMIITTIEQNPPNLTSKFLVHLVERISAMPFPRVPQDLIKRVVQELAKRIENKELEQFLILQLCQNLDKNYKHEEFLKVLQTLENQPPKLLDYLYLQGVNIKTQIEAYYENNKSKKIPVFYAAHYVVYAARDAKEIAEELMPICREYIAQNPFVALKTFREVDISAQVKYQLQEEAFMALIEQVKTQKTEFSKVVKELLNSAINKKCRQAFIQLFDEQPVQNTKMLFNRLVSEFDNFNSETLNIVLQILQKDPVNIPLNRLVDFLSLNQHKLIGLIKSDQIQWATQVICTCFLSKTDMKFFPVINFVHRFENAGYHSRFISSLLRRVAEHFKKANPNSPYPDSLFVSALINYNLLTPQEAVIQLNNERCMGQQRVQVCGLALLADPVPESVNQLAAQLKADSISQLNQDSAKYSALYNLVTLGQYKESELDDMKKRLKTVSAKMSPKQFFDLVLGCKDYQIMREFVAYFQQQGPKLGINRAIRVVEKFQSLNTGSQMVYNILLELLGTNFNHLQNEQRIQILNIFTQAKLKQLDVFKKSLERIARSPTQYKNYFNDILDDVFELGFTEQEIVTLIKQIFEKVTLNDYQALKLLFYYVLTEQPLEEIEKVASLIPQLKTKEYFKTLHLYEILKRQYPESKALAIFDTLLKEESYQKYLETNLAGNKKQPFPTEQIVQFLNVLGVKFQQNQQINGVNIEIYLPENDAAVYILQGTLTNYDKVSLSGIATFHKKLLSLVAKNVVLVNFKEFNQITNNDDKAKFLINSGIPVTVDPKTVDYSSIQKSYSGEQQQKKSELSQ